MISEVLLKSRGELFIIFKKMVVIHQKNKVFKPRNDFKNSDFDKIDDILVILIKINFSHQ
jgi:hypothetical protein